MAVSSKNKKLLDDPETPTEIVEGLAMNYDLQTSRLAARHPNLTIETWRDKMKSGIPEAWESPLALIEMMDWQSSEPPYFYAVNAYAQVVEKKRKGVSSEVPEILANVLEDGWRQEKNGAYMANEMAKWCLAGNEAMWTQALSPFLFQSLESVRGSCQITRLLEVWDEAVAVMKSGVDKKDIRAKIGGKHIESLHKEYSKHLDKNWNPIHQSFGALRAMYFGFIERKDSPSWFANAISLIADVRYTTQQAPSRDEALEGLANEFRVITPSILPLL